MPDHIAQIRELIELAEKATVEPWECVPQTDGSSFIAHPYETGKQINPKGLRLIAHIMMRGNSLKENEASAAFIAAARNAIPALVEVLRDAERFRRLIRDHYQPQSTIDMLDSAILAERKGDSND